MGAYIIKTGIAVHLSEEQFTDLSFDQDGYLTSFVFNENNYFFLDLTFEDSSRHRLLGYYDLEDYAEYLEGGLKLAKLEYFSFNPYLIKELAPVTITFYRLEYNPPFTDFFHKVKYSFPSESRNKNYRDKYGKIIAPISAQREVVVANENQMGWDNFYDRYLRNYITYWLDNEKITQFEGMMYSKVTTEICLLIRMIDLEITPRLTNTAFDRIPPPNVNALSLFDKIILSLYQSWGLVEGEHEKAILLTQEDPTDLKHYNDYKNALNNFYLKYISGDFHLISDSEKILKILPIVPTAIVHNIPVETLIETLKFLLKYSHFFSSKYKDDYENVIVKISLSIKASDADAFLDYLLTKSDGIRTVFEQLYSLVSDERFSRKFPFIGSIYRLYNPKFSNRKSFVYATYELWKKSNYNCYHIPEGENPNPDGLNESSYFLQEANIHWAQLRFVPYFEKMTE